MGQFSAKISPNPGSLLSGNQQSVPGVGTVTASAFVAAVEDPENFRNSRAVGAWVGLTPRRYQSGEVDHDGHISRRGDSHLRGLLYEAAAVPEPVERCLHLANLGVRVERTYRLQTSGRRLGPQIGSDHACHAPDGRAGSSIHMEGCPRLPEPDSADYLRGFY